MRSQEVRIYELKETLGGVFFYSLLFLYVQSAGTITLQENTPENVVSVQN